MTRNIDITAVVDKCATIADGVTVGPYCVVGSEVTLGEGVVLHSHVAITGHTEIGAGTQIFPFASLGHAPQDLKYKGEASKLVIGKGNMIREHVTMNPGTAGGGLLTSVGDNCLFMTSSHVAHDCNVGNNVILANNATLAGHVKVGDHAIIGGLSAIHQFVRIGKHAIIGGMSGVEHDVIPYGSVIGERAGLAGLNIVGLKRRGVERAEIHALRAAFKIIFASNDGTISERAAQAEQQFKDIALIQDVIGFIRDRGSRSLCVPKHNILTESETD